MAQRETEHKRIVVETPTSRREVEQTEAVHHHRDRSGISGGALAAIVVGVIALATIIILFVMNQNQQQTADELAASQQQPGTTIVQQPAQQPPVVIQQPATTSQPPVIINNPPASGGSAPATGNADAAIQAAVDKRLSEDPTFSSLGITATVLDGKVMLTGIVKSEALKAQVERAVRNLKEVKAVDNQISVG